MSRRIASVLHRLADPLPAETGNRGRAGNRKRGEKQDRWIWQGPGAAGEGIRRHGSERGGRRESAASMESVVGRAVKDRINVRIRCCHGNHRQGRQCRLGRRRGRQCVTRLLSSGAVGALHRGAADDGSGAPVVPRRIDGDVAAVVFRKRDVAQAQGGDQKEMDSQGPGDGGDFFASFSALPLPLTSHGTVQVGISIRRSGWLDSSLKGGD